MPAETALAEPSTVNLALQGGGTHGAFTWGVLDALLEDGRISFEGVSGTSAGAINAVALAHGLANGGVEAARESLNAVWQAVADSAVFVSAMTNEVNSEPRMTSAFKLMKRLTTTYFSPDQLNPFDLNPLRDILAKQIDFERLQKKSPVKLFIAATNANSGKLRLFQGKEVSIDAVLASACLPTIHRSIMIGGEPYWDGGYSANPAVFPLFYHCQSDDILMVLLAPLKYEETPYSAQDIRLRQQEIAFQSTFLREMRMFAHLREYVEDTSNEACRFENKIKRACFHVIAAEEKMGELAVETKLIPKQGFLDMLRDMGREHGQRWLKAHFKNIGKQSTVDLAKLFY